MTLFNCFVLNYFSCCILCTFFIYLVKDLGPEGALLVPLLFFSVNDLLMVHYMM